MEQITVVIGDRLGKGQKVAAGAEKAGAFPLAASGSGRHAVPGEIPAHRS